MDKLYESAKAFSVLTDIEYHLIIGRKGKAVTLHVTFEPAQFHHLAGLHKLKDLALASRNREGVFRDILQGKYTLEDIMKSDFLEDCLVRLGPLGCLEHLFDANQLVFRYDANVQVFSVIEADFLMSTPLQDGTIYVFLAQSDVDTYFCRSIFPQTGRDYTQGQAKFTLLYKEKINRRTGAREIQYDRLHKK